MSVAPLEQVQPPELPPVLSELDDAELVERARRGRDEAFGQLFTRHQNRLRRNASSIVTGADLDDVSQRAWLKIYQKLHTLREPRLFYAWASRVMINTALAFVRKAGRRSETSIDDLTPGNMPAADAPSAAEKVRWQSMLEKTRQWFAELDTRDRILFRHFMVDGMTMEQIGEKVGMSSGGVKTRLFRARQKLRARRDALVQD